MIVEAGDAFAKSPTLADAVLGQAALKATLQVRSLVADGLSAFVPGAGDLALGADFLQRMIDEQGLPVLAANLTCGARGYPGTRVVEAAGRRVGLIGLVVGSLRPCQVGDPATALTASLEALGPVDLTVLVLNGDRSAVKALAAGITAVDFVVTGGAGQTLKQPKRLEDGPWQLAVGSRGKKLGVLALEWREGATGWIGQGEVETIARRLDRYRERVDDMARRAADADDDAARRRAQVQRGHYQDEVTRLEAELTAAVAEAEGGDSHHFVHHQVELDATLSDHPRVVPWMAETKDAVNALASSGGKRPDYTGPFVGSARCSSCHTPEYQQWKTTGHARAWPTLVDAGRQGDPDCVSCHVTGQWHDGGPAGVDVPTHLRGVGCEDCHGPGQAHVASPVEASMGQVPDAAACVQCHDGERDEGRFDFETYLPRIVHQPR